MWINNTYFWNYECDALSAYVALCNKHNICIKWRTPDYCCELKYFTFKRYFIPLQYFYILLLCIVLFQSQPVYVQVKVSQSRWAKIMAAMASLKDFVPQIFQMYNFVVYF